MIKMKSNKKKITMAIGMVLGVTVLDSERHSQATTHQTDMTWLRRLLKV